MLEGPLGTEARAGDKAVVPGEIDGKFDFRTDMEVVATEMTADIVPELGFGNEDEILLLQIRFHEVDDLLTPDIGETAETEAFDTQEVLHAPDERELQRNI